MGLRLYMNNGQRTNWQFGPDEVSFYRHHPEYNRSPTRMRGTPTSDTIEFGFDRYLYFSIHSWWESYLAYGVKQRRLVTGELVLEALRGEMLRACWDIVDRRTGARLVETATGVIAATADLTPYREQWTLTLYRGDYLLRNGELEPATYGCGGTL